MIVSLFFILRDQQELRGALFSVLPFTRGHENEISEEVVKITRSTLLGTFLTAFAHAVAAAVGFWFSGVPVLFGAVAAGFASFIPVGRYRGRLVTCDPVPAVHQQGWICRILEYLVAYSGCFYSGSRAKAHAYEWTNSHEHTLGFSLHSWRDSFFRATGALVWSTCPRHSLYSCPSIRPYHSANGDAAVKGVRSWVKRGRLKESGSQSFYSWTWLSAPFPGG